MKKTITINLDIDLIEKGKKKGLNMSATINDLLINFFGPKVANKKEEEELLILRDIAVKMKLSPNEVQFLKEHQARQTIGVWRMFKEKFNPDYNIFAFMDKRKVFEELLTKLSKEKK